MQLNHIALVGLLLSAVALCAVAQEQTPRRMQIAFTVWQGGGNQDIYVMDADGGDIRRLTKHHTRDTQPAWSPDGRRIAFTSTRDGHNEIYVMDADGNNVRRLTRSAGCHDPAWSPDGQTIAFNDPRAIYLVNADGRNLRPLVGGMAKGAFSPAWSPDGKKLVFMTGEWWGVAGIYTVDVNGENIRKVVDDGARNRSPVWSPDGKQIVFARNGQIHIMDVDGQNIHRLAQGEEPDCFDPALAVFPAGKRPTTWGWLKQLFDSEPLRKPSVE